jgi:dCTP deaminase
MDARAVSFDPESLSVRTFEITDFLTNPAKRIYRLELDSGRSVHVTADHNVFTLDEHGAVTRIPTADAEGSLVMVPGSLPGPRGVQSTIDLATLLPDTMEEIVVYAGDGLGTVDWSDTHATTRKHYQGKDAAPLHRVSYRAIPADAEIGFKQSTYRVPRRLPVTPELGWVLGFYVAEGYARRKQVVFTNTDETLLERVEAYFETYDACLSWQHDDEGASHLTVCSALWSAILRHLAGAGGEKNIPPRAWNWEDSVLEAFYEGLLEGDGHRRDGRDTLYTVNEELADRAQYLGSRLGLRTSAYARERESDEGVRRTEWSIDFYETAHKRGAYVPNPAALLRAYREQAGLTLAEAATAMGFSSNSSVSNVENREYGSVKRDTLERFRDCYRDHGVRTDRLDAILAGSVQFDRVDMVVDTGRVETTYDLEVQPAGRAVENFLGGFGGIFLSNTAGFIDPGFRGHITLELSNLGSAPVALSPGMRISQIVFTELKTPARQPYGSGRGSKYQDQSGPAASRIQDDDEFGGDQR